MRKVLVTGAAGQLGRRLVARLLREAGIHPIGWTRPGGRPPKGTEPSVPGTEPSYAKGTEQYVPGFRPPKGTEPSVPGTEPSYANLTRGRSPLLFLPVDLLDAVTTERAFLAIRPDAVIHCAAVTKIADAHRDPAAAQALNVDATARLAALCARTGTRLVYVSTDMVFAGDRGKYAETDEPNPLTTYGRTKLAGERAATSAHPSVAIARMALMYDPVPATDAGFFESLLSNLLSGRTVQAFGDEWRTPLTYTAACDALVALALSPRFGIFHVGGTERVSRLDMAIRAAQTLGVPASLVVPTRQASLPAPEPRPRDLSLVVTRFQAAFPDVPLSGFASSLAPLASARGVYYTE